MVNGTAYGIMRTPQPTREKTSMQLSFYCRKCKLHIRSGDHSTCRKALKAEDRAEQLRQTADRARLEEATKAGYANGSAARYFERVAALQTPQAD